jgi:hypothetical protein
LDGNISITYYKGLSTLKILLIIWVNDNPCSIYAYRFLAAIFENSVPVATKPRKWGKAEVLLHHSLAQATLEDLTWIFAETIFRLFR